MLRPQDNGIRECKRLDGVWAFTPDAAGAGRRDEWWRGPLPDARTIAVPASYNDLFVDEQLHDHVGDVWYQRTVYAPAGWDGRVSCSASTPRPIERSVWVDDELVVEHEGGYTPFEADISHLAAPGRALRVTAVVNNELTFQSVPPGVIQVQPDGTRTQRYYHDFFNYAGLHRSVWLHSTPVDHIDDVTVVTDVDGSTGVVQYRVEVAGDAAVRVALRDADGTVVAEASGGTGELRVDDAHLWAPGHGYLHELTVELLDGDDVVDRYLQPVGIRSVRVEGAQFLINGEPFYFRGFGMHEDHLARGKGHDNASMIHDFALLDWIGANSFRTSHYPYAEEILDEADRRGIVVIDETAAVGQNLGMGGGFFMGGTFKTFSDETLNDVTQEVHRQAIRELVARDKNHPSVVLWSVANEPESHTEESLAYFEPLFAATPRGRPEPAGRFRQRDARAVRQVPGDAARRRRDGQPLLRLVRGHGRPGRGGTQPGGRADGVGRHVRQADHHHRVRRRHDPRVQLGPAGAVERGVPVRAPGDVPPRVRPDPGGGRRARVELRRLRDDRLDPACRRQQEGRVHPRPGAEGGGTCAP